MIRHLSAFSFVAVTLAVSGALPVPVAGFHGPTAATAAAVHGNHTPKIDIDRPWARETSRSAPSAAVYMGLTYQSKGSDTLIGASSPRAEMVMIHDTIMDGNIAMMREAEDGVDLQKGVKVSFEPGGKHIMMVGLTERLVKGQVFPLTLHFEKADDITIMVEVTPVTGPDQTE